MKSRHRLSQQASSQASPVVTMSEDLRRGNPDDVNGRQVGSFSFTNKPLVPSRSAGSGDASASGTRLPEDSSITGGKPLF